MEQVYTVELLFNNIFIAWYSTLDCNSDSHNNPEAHPWFKTVDMVQWYKAKVILWSIHSIPLLT